MDASGKKPAESLPFSQGPAVEDFSSLSSSTSEHSFVLSLYDNCVVMGK